MSLLDSVNQQKNPVTQQPKMEIYEKTPCPHTEEGRCKLDTKRFFPCTGYWYITCTIYMQNRGDSE